MLALCLMLLVTYHALNNYAGIIGLGLIHKDYEIETPQNFYILVM